MPPTSSSREPLASSRAWMAAAVLVLAGVAVYLNGLAAPFVFDDRDVIERNPSIRSLAGSFFPPAADGMTTSGRPLVNVTLALNHLLGGTDVGIYHVTNLLIHLLAGVVLYALLRRLLGAAAPGECKLIDDIPDGGSRVGHHLTDDSASGAAGWNPVAWVAALLWMVHPLQTESVTYTAQRAESMVGLFLLLTIYAFLRATDPAGAARRRFWQGATVAAGLLGVFCKEVMVVAPVVVFLLDRTFVGGSFRVAWRHRRGLHLALFATWLPLAWLVAGSAGRGGTAGLSAQVSPWHYLLTQAWAVPHYLRLALWPSPLVFDYGIGLIRNPAEVIVPGLVVLALLGLTVWALVRRPRVGFALAFFFLVLAPSSSVVPVATQVIAEHRMYLALAAVTALVAVGLHRWLGRAALGVGIALAVALGAVTVARNRDYQSELGIWQDIAAKRPQNARAHANIGQLLSEQGREPEALAAYAEALRLLPAQPRTLFNAGLSLTNLGRLDEAIGRYAAAVELDPKYTDARINLGLLLLEKGRAPEALVHLAEAAKLAPEQPEALSGWGSALAQTGKLTEAGDVFNRALAKATEPAMVANLHFNLGNVGMAAGRPDQAAREFALAAGLSPENAPAHFNLAVALLRLGGRNSEAAAHLEQALRIDPGLPRAREMLAELRRSAPVSP
jgi:tetratricopeptide (TPR) repeat protein